MLHLLERFHQLRFTARFGLPFRREFRFLARITRLPLRLGLDDRHCSIANAGAVTSTSVSRTPGRMKDAAVAWILLVKCRVAGFAVIISGFYRGSFPRWS